MSVPVAGEVEIFQMDEQMRAMDRSLLEKIAADIEMLDKDEGMLYFILI